MARKQAATEETMQLVLNELIRVRQIGQRLLDVQEDNLNTQRSSNSALRRLAPSHAGSGEIPIVRP